MAKKIMDDGWDKEVLAYVNQGKKDAKKASTQKSVKKSSNKKKK